MTDDMKKCSSPVCAAAEAEDSYMGYATNEELVAFLNELLEAERAGSRVALETAATISDADLKALVSAIQKDEARWCAALLRAIAAVDGVASVKVGAFHEKAMAIDDIPARLAFLNRGQGWVVRKLSEMLPKIRNDSIHRDLTDMLDSHQRNIRLVEEHGSAPEARG